MATIEYEDELSRLWAIVNNLADQLSNNRALVVQLKSRSENIKGQAVHAGAGFPLRRFNLDISHEEFNSELEAFASHLVMDNQTLQHENKQLNSLLKEYEQTLETVMGKFRGVAHASQQHDLSLHSYYSSLLQSLQTAHSSAQLHDDTSLSLLLTRLSTLLRSALRSLDGEESNDVDAATQLPGLLHLAESAHRKRISDPSSAGSSVSPSRSIAPHSTVPRAPARRQQFPGFLPGTSGGYFGTDGQGDWALEREMEIQRLEEENKVLREMLGIDTEIISEGIPEGEDEQKDAHESPQAGGGRRKSSLTMDELEADAEKEEAEKERLVQLEEDLLEDEEMLRNSAIFAHPKNGHDAENPYANNRPNPHVQPGHPPAQQPIDAAVLGFRAEANGEGGASLGEVFEDGDA